MKMIICIYVFTILMPCIADDAIEAVKNKRLENLDKQYAKARTMILSSAKSSYEKELKKTTDPVKAADVRNKIAALSADIEGGPSKTDDKEFKACKEVWHKYFLKHKTTGEILDRRLPGSAGYSLYGRSIYYYDRHAGEFPVLRDTRTDLGQYRLLSDSEFKDVMTKTKFYHLVRVTTFKKCGVCAGRGWIKRPDQTFTQDCSYCRGKKGKEAVTHVEEEWTPGCPAERAEDD